jgi:hypothetical protein
MQSLDTAARPKATPINEYSRFQIPHTFGLGFLDNLRTTDWNFTNPVWNLSIANILSRYPFLH